MWTDVSTWFQRYRVTVQFTPLSNTYTETVAVMWSDTYSALFETIKGSRRIVQTQKLPHGQAEEDKKRTKGGCLYSCSRVTAWMALGWDAFSHEVTSRTSWQCPCVRWDFARRPAVPTAGPPGSHCRSCLWTSAWVAARDGSLETCLSAATHMHKAKMICTYTINIYK